MSIHSDIQSVAPGVPTPGVVRGNLYIVDDNQEFRRSLEILLGTFGLSTRSFASAAEFLRELPLLAPAPLLLDVTMPAMNGIELLELLVARQVNWPVVILTGLNDVPLAFRALQLGAVSVLEKPFSADDLETAVRAALVMMSDPALLPSGTICHAGG